MIDFNLIELREHFDVAINSKRNEDQEDAKLRRMKEKWLFIFTLIGITFSFLTCIYIIIFKENSTLVNIALGSVTSLTFALIGYYVRGKPN